MSRFHTRAEPACDTSGEAEQTEPQHPVFQRRYSTVRVPSIVTRCVGETTAFASQGARVHRVQFLVDSSSAALRVEDGRGM